MRNSQAKNTLNEKRQSGTDVFSCKIVSMDFKIPVEGRYRIQDMHNGLYNVYYTVPMPGRYQVHVYHADLGAPEPGQIRGSPFVIDCKDPWTKHRIMGAAPAKRKGMSLVTLGGDLVAYGGDRTGISVCAASGSDWKWTNPTPVGEDTPEDKSLPAVIIKKDTMISFGGVSLNSNNDTADLAFLKKTEEGWTWTKVKEHAPYMRRAKEGEEEAPTEPQPIKARNSASIWVVEKDLYVFGGENDGDLMQEFAVMDTTNKETAEWIEPAVEGELPSARKGAAACASGRQAILFSGASVNEEGMAVTLEDIYLLEVTGPASVRCTALEIKGASPAPRSYAMFQKLAPKKLMLYGGMSADNKPLNDAWLFDMEHMSWTCLFYGHSDLVLPTGSVATLSEGRLVVLNSGAGALLRNLSCLYLSCDALAASLPLLCACPLVPLACYLLPQPAQYPRRRR